MPNHEFPTLSDFRSAFMIEYPRTQRAYYASQFEGLRNRIIGHLIQADYDSDRIISLFERFGITLMLCDWEDNLFEGEFYTTGSGAVVSPEAYHRFGFTCDSCGDIERRARSLPFRGGERCCQYCVDNRDISWSERTDSYWPHDEFPDDDDDDESNTYRPSGNLIHSYSTNPLGLFRRDKAFVFIAGERLPRFPRWLGVELEVEPKQEVASNRVDYVRLTHDAVNQFAILKQDGSIAGNGFEIVTVPATLRKQRELWKPFFDGPAQHLRSWFTNGRCGMHVHIARNSMSALTLGRMLVFINSYETRPFIETVAGRNAGEYNRYFPKKLTDGKNHRTDHYDALSLSGHGTVELRIFRGNTSFFGFYKNLDFADALVEFCKVASNRDLTQDHFLQWLVEPKIRTAYPYLTSWAVLRGLIKVKVQKAMQTELAAA